MTRAFSYSFVQWVRQQLLAALQGEVTEDSVFDPTQTDLYERVRRALASGLGWCIAIGPVQAAPLEERSDTLAAYHEMSTTISFLRSPLCKIDTTAIAETAYRFFLTQHWQAVENLFPPDISCSQFSNTLNRNGDMEATFTLYAPCDLTRMN